jgi:hypothetical protein
MMTFLILAIVLVFLIGGLVFWSPWATGNAGTGGGGGSGGGGGGDGSGGGGGGDGGGGAPSSYFEPIPETHRLIYIG